MTMSKTETIDRVEYLDESLEAVLQQVYKLYGEDVCLFCSFGKDSTVLLWKITHMGWDIPVVFIHTGLQYKETHAFRKDLQKKWRFPLIEVHSRLTREELDEHYGWKDGEYDIATCCKFLKHEPSDIITSRYNAIITGLRRDETPDRKDLEQMELLTKPHRINPLVEWTQDDIWKYIKHYKIPYNPLYDKGYRSIGCKPCTEQNRWGTAERFGRPDCKWWKGEET